VGTPKIRFGSDNNKVGVFACAKDFSALLEMTEGEGVGFASREMTEGPMPL
jgi:hypothetical protein